MTDAGAKIRFEPVLRHVAQRCQAQAHQLGHDQGRFEAAELGDVHAIVSQAYPKTSIQFRGEEVGQGSAARQHAIACGELLHGQWIEGLGVNLQYQVIGGIEAVLQLAR